MFYEVSSSNQNIFSWSKLERHHRHHGNGLVWVKILFRNWSDIADSCSQPSPWLELHSHPLPFRHRSLHARSLVANRTLRISDDNDNDRALLSWKSSNFTLFVMILITYRAWYWIVDCPTRWSLWYWWYRSSSWRPWPHIGWGRMVWPLLRPQKAVLDHFFCKICF